MSDNSEDYDDAAPTPLIEDNNGDDDEPPAAGACTVEFDTPSMTISKAPTAEPENKAKPKIPVTA